MAQHALGESNAMGSLKHPLENVRVIDLGRHQAGPRCAQVLARMGAEVIKIERLGGEETRYHGPGCVNRAPTGSSTTRAKRASAWTCVMKKASRS